MNRLLLISALALSITACDSSGSRGKPKPVTPEQLPEAPLKDLEVQNYEVSGGQRLRVIDSDGKVILEGEPIPTNERIYRSRGFVAYVYEDQGTRLKTFNYQGRDLNTGADLLRGDYRIYISDHLLAIYSESSDGNRLRTINKDGESIPTAAELLNKDSKIMISDNIIAYTAPSHSRGALLSQEGNTSTYATINTGVRLHAYNRYGKELGLASQLVDGDSKLFVSSKIVALTAMSTRQGQLLKEEGNVKTYSAVPTGRRLYATSYLGQTLGTSSQVLDDETKITVNDTFILMNVPFRAGRQDFVYLLDGTVH